METPSSSLRTATRSQALLSSQKKTQDGESRKAEQRSALVDITNDSPIVGLAAGSLKTPCSSLAKRSKGHMPGKTPGSGEALLRGQVKTLLQRVEEESELVKLPPSSVGTAVAPFRVLLGHLRSPGGLLAPTPANTPQIVAGLSKEEEEESGDDDGLLHSAAIPNQPEQSDLPKVAGEEDHLMIECQLNRALLFDSPEKSEISGTSSSVSSALTYQGTARSFAEKSTDDDCSSAWSIRANAGSSPEEDGEEEEVDESYYDDLDDDEEEEDVGCDDSSMLGDLCDGLSKMTVAEEERSSSRGLPEFTGKHTRFVYNSDDEIEGEEVEENHVAVSPSVLLLKGLPAPEGKHLRFHEEEEAAED